MRESVTLCQKSKRRTTPRRSARVARCRNHRPLEVVADELADLRSIAGNGPRRAMHPRGLEALALYPEERTTHRPTCEQIFCLFSLAQRHLLAHHGQHVKSFEPEITELQRQVLDCLGVPESAYITAH